MKTQLRQNKIWQTLINGLLLIVLLVVSSGCGTRAATPSVLPTEKPAATSVPTEKATDRPTDNPTNTPEPSATAPPTETPRPSEPPSATPTITAVPTQRYTPTPKPTPFGGSNGYIMTMVNLSLVKMSLKDSSDYEVLVSGDDIVSNLGIKQLSTTRNDIISHDGEVAAFWNCATEYCNSYRGTLYLFSLDFKKKAEANVPGYPVFINWSAEHDRLLYYLSSNMASDYYLIKTKDPGFGEVIKLGQMSSARWSPDGQTLYAQKGGTVYQYDKDGKALKKWECKFNNACMYALSPDGTHFAAIQKFVTTSEGNPVINITDPEFVEKKSLYLSDQHALIVHVEWLPDNQHIVVIGESSKQSNRRYWRLDYASVIDVQTGSERLIDFEIPQDSETFSFCGLTPDGSQLVYLASGGRVNQGGHVLSSGRNIMTLPIWDTQPTLTRLTNFEEAWESCPSWQEEGNPSN